MIDLHCHILPSLDDGATDLETSLAMAHAAVSEGTQKVVATPHINSEYSSSAEQIAHGVGELNLALVQNHIPLAVLPGAEIAVPRLEGMDNETLRKFSLGGGPCVLVESPYQSSVAFLEEVLFDLQVRGFLPLLAHPERSPLFLRDLPRLSRLVDHGVLVSITAGSISGQFGSKVRRFAFSLLQAGLVHNVATDAHDLTRRPPLLKPAFEQADRALPGFAQQESWYADAAPVKILLGERPSARPDIPQARYSLLRRITRRR